MPNNCQYPELCMLSETCIPCAICPNAKEKADDRLALTTCSPFCDTPETQTKVKRICGNWNNAGDRVREFVFADVARKLERERNAAIDLARRAMKMLDLAEDAEITEWLDTSAIDELVKSITVILPENVKEHAPPLAGASVETGGEG